MSQSQVIEAGHGTEEFVGSLLIFFSFAVMASRYHFGIVMLTMC